MDKKTLLDLINSGAITVIGSRTTPADGIHKLGYNPNTRNFRNQKTDQIEIDGVERQFTSYYIHDYYPKNRYGGSVDENIQNIRRLVYGFKDGLDTTQVAQIMVESIQLQKINLDNHCLAIIPASGQIKTIHRYSTFCDIICDNLGIKNAFSAISTKPHAANKGKSGGDKICFYSFDESEYKNMRVLLFDDIRTSGTTYKQTLSKLMITGALEDDSRIFLAKTI